MSKRKNHEKVPADPQPQTGAAAGPAGSAVPASDPLVETGAGGAAETGGPEQQGNTAGALSPAGGVNDADAGGQPAPDGAALLGAGNDPAQLPGSDSAAVASTDLEPQPAGSGSVRDNTSAPVAGGQLASANTTGNAGLDGEGGSVLGADAGGKLITPSADPATLDGEDPELAYVESYGGPFAYNAVSATWSAIYPLMDGEEAGALIRELFTPAATRDLGDLIRRIGTSATVPVLASQLMLSRHRDNKELNRLEVLALDVFSHTLLALEGYKARSIEIEEAEARLANAVPAPPLPIEETTLETVDGPGDTWG